MRVQARLITTVLMNRVKFICALNEQWYATVLHHVTVAPLKAM
jgi:hypothetical protein